MLTNKDLEQGEIARQILEKGFKKTSKKSHYSYQDLLKILFECSKNPSFSKNQKASFLAVLKRELYRQKFFEKKVGVLADTHIGSEDENIEYIKRTYEEFFKQGIFEVWHLGDLLEGYGSNNALSDSQKLELFLEQLHEFKELYPKGFQNYVTYGNHGEQFLECNINLVEKIPELRPDFISLGFGSNYVFWNDLAVNLTHYTHKRPIILPSDWDFQLRGHSHFYSKKGKSIYVPTCSDNHPSNVFCSNEPGFLILEEDEEKNVFMNRYGFFENRSQLLIRELIKPKSE